MLSLLGLEIVKVRDTHPVIQILLVIVGILVALVISGVFISFSGADPIEAFSIMIKGAFGEPRKVWETLLRSTPLMLTGLATVISFRAQIWSIGQEGQLLAGAMLGFMLYRIFQPILLRPALLAVIVLGGFLGGALLGLLSGWMRARFKVDIIISTVMMNYIITTMLLFLLYDQKYWMGTTTYYPRTDQIANDSISFDLISHLTVLLSQVHVYLPISLLVLLHPNQTSQHQPVFLQPGWQLTDHWR